jgi:hypothetical protein
MVKSESAERKRDIRRTSKYQLKAVIKVQKYKQFEYSNFSS